MIAHKLLDDLAHVGELTRIRIAAHILHLVRWRNRHIGEDDNVGTVPRHLVVDRLRDGHVEFLALGTDAGGQRRHQPLLLVDGVADASAQLFAKTQERMM